ncbi:hypothetical protein [Marinilabilia rubra]|uniref:Uncharacterized protein n=1 Tax=Marinilabilia rubra TaxID=2162893 RepID=A0A2U2BAC4_9BACT|nr:hypothetical protein [Marinilabilia rubra]PWE00019.1 hypothetical protein DDZ16_06550 [Marinilabilia rubra]
MLENFDILSKWFVATASLLTVLLKVLDSLSKERRKKSLADDLKLIRDLLDRKTHESDVISEELYFQKIEEYILLSDSRFKWFNTLYALLLFVGFGYWTIYLIDNSNDFNPWSLLTALISIVGVGLLLDTDFKSKQKDKKLFSIEILKGIYTGIIMLLFSTVSALVLLLNFSGYTNWYIIPGVLLPLSLKVIHDSIEIKKNKLPTIHEKTIGGQ